MANVDLTKPLFTIQQTAEFLNASIASVSRWWRADLIPQPRRVGRRGLRWIPNELIAYLERQQDAEDEAETFPINVGDE